MEESGIVSIIAFIASIILLVVFVIQLIKRIYSAKNSDVIHLKINDKEVTLSKKADHKDAQKLIKHLKAS